MNYSVNETHNPELRSWVDSANDPKCDFPIQNIPFGVFIQSEDDPFTNLGAAIGDQILDLGAVAENLWLDDFFDEVADACAADVFNALMELGPEEWSDLRRRVSGLLRSDNKTSDRAVAEDCLIPMSEVQMVLPAFIGNYTDFYASVYHATNIGRMFRPDQPLMPNYKWVPIGYHGRASSIVVSGTPIKRPSGQLMDEGSTAPVYAPSKVLDYELEVGFFVGQGNEQGAPIKINDAEKYIFGLCLVNDWSARDIQRWEYQPLGPFLSKSFATSISPWIVTMEALAPFRAPAFVRNEGDPQPLPYLDSLDDRNRGGLEIQLEVLISTEQMRRTGMPPHRVSHSNTRDLYWTFAQMLTHHTSNGCDLEPGDLIASGTVSGAEKENFGCLLELTSRGAEPISLPNGEVRRFLQDGDEVIMRGFCEREGFRRIGFGECTGKIVDCELQIIADC